MNKAFWGIMVIMIGVAAILLITFFQSITNTEEHNSQLLKEVTEAAMWDALDYSAYRSHGVIKINKEKFVENFLRRFADSAGLSRTYTIEFMDVNEVPPKVSVRVTSRSGSTAATSALGRGNPSDDFGLVNKIDAILEMPY